MFYTMDAHLWFAFACSIVCLLVSFYGFFRHEDALFGHLNRSGAQFTDEVEMEERKPSFRRSHQKPKSVSSFIKTSLIKPITFKDTLRIE